MGRIIPRPSGGPATPAYLSTSLSLIPTRLVAFLTEPATATATATARPHPPAPMASSALAVSVAKPAASPPVAVAAVTPQRRLLPQCRGVRAAPVVRLRSGRARGVSVVCAAQGQETSFQVPDVTKSTWQSLVVESELPVLVEFWASWCGPCKMIDPVIGKLSKEYEGKLNCYKLNTDENPDIATQFGIRSIPTMMIFKNGEKKDAVIGAVPESTLVSSIDKYIGR